MPAPRGQWRDWGGGYDEDLPPVEEPLQLTQEQHDATILWGSSVWAFCTGVWPLQTHVSQKGSREPRPIIWTQDMRRNKVRPFPHYPYLRECILEPIFHAPLVAPDGSPLQHQFAVPKPRQLFVTNGILAGCLWDVLFHDATQWFVAKNTAPEANNFVRLRVREIYKRMPHWFAGISGPNGWTGWRNVPRKPAGQFEVAETSSRIAGVPRTFAESGAGVGETANVLLDECVRIRNLPAVWDAIEPMAPRIVAVSAPTEVGQRVDPLSVAFFREKFEGLEPGTLTRTALARLDKPEEMDLVGDEAA